jgi:nucleoside 2-deoxyribosyltransferase
MLLFGGESMETCRIYLSGGMGSLSFEEQSKWRKQVTNAILFGDYNWEKKPIFFNPVDYYNFTDVKYKTEREVVEFDLNALRHSDLVIVNFNDPKSLGTCAELAIAYEMKIPVIGINIDNLELHPWLVEFTTRMCDSIKEAVEHVVDFYLN